jgi:L-amino acid N-acyltransferase YncA
MVRKVRESDAPTLCQIYNKYVLGTRITFEEALVETEEMVSRIRKVLKKYPWLVYEERGKVHGYAYASQWKERSAYRYAVEAGIYLDPDYVGKGIGTALIGELLKQLREASFHSVIAGVALPNPASIALCEKCGFEKVAHFRQVGFKLGKWIDVGYWELILKPPPEQ